MDLQNIITNLNMINFVAIDVETANEQRNSICSIGVVTVKRGEIVSAKNFLVKPFEMRFSSYNKLIHKITEHDVAEAKELNSIWDELLPLIDNQILLAHNAYFDIDALNQTLTAYSIDVLSNKFICTQKLAQESFKDLNNFRLPDVASYMGLDCNHHDCISDATICAEIGIKAIPIYNKDNYSYKYQELTYNIQKRASAEKKDGFLTELSGKKNISSQLLKPNLEVADKGNPFFKKKIVFTGDLKKISRQEAAVKVQSMGADIDTGISKRTQIVIVGEVPGPSKMKKIEELNAAGCSIRLIFEDEFLTLIKNIL